MAYSIEKIRNICLLGHGGDGKTSLTESILYANKVTDRLGKVTDGNTVSDYDPEEIKRVISIQTSVCPVETGGYKINVLDAPGFFDFVGEVTEAPVSYTHLDVYKRQATIPPMAVSIIITRPKRATNLCFPVRL